MGLRRFFRKVIPKEIRKPISKVTETIEDAVRPVTDPVRRFVSKAIPKELKPFLSSGVAIATGAFGGPAGAFLRTAIIDAMLQKAMTDPDAEDTGISLAQSLTAGAGGALKSAASLPKIELGKQIGPRPIDFEKLTIGDKLTNLGIEAGQMVEPFLTAPNLDMSLPDIGKQALKYSTGLATIQTPQGVENIKKEIETQKDAMAASEAAKRTNIDEFMNSRKMAMLGSFERAGFEPEETQREIQEEGIDVTLEEVQDYFNTARATAADGGRIGFQDGTQEMTVGNYILEERARRKFLDMLSRKMRAQKFNMEQELPGPIMRNLNMLNPFDKDPTGRQEIFDMEKRFLDLRGQMLNQGLERAKEFNQFLEKLPMPRTNRKDEFESYVNMIDKNFPARNNTEGRQFANQGGRMTPEGDPISPDVPAGMQMDLRGGGFIPLGTKPRADDVPAMVGKNEFVLNDRAVSGIGKMLTGNPDPRAGARALYQLQENMEAIV